VYEIEVLMSMAILGFALTLAYGMTNRGLAAIRSGQERVEALKVAEQQIERIKAVVISNPAAIYKATTETFCVNSDLTQTTFPGASLPLPDLQSDNFAYPTECRGMGAGAFYNVSVEGPIITTINGISIPSDQGGIFRVKVRWDRLGGGKEEVKLEYATYKEN
jgi:type II secretory pathway pseudopilin PulG